MIEGMVEAFTSFVYIKDPQNEESRRLKEIAECRVLGTDLKGVIDDVCRDYLYQSECFIHAYTHTADILIKGDDPKVKLLIEEQTMVVARQLFVVVLVQ